MYISHDLCVRFLLCNFILHIAKMALCPHCKTETVSIQRLEFHLKYDHQIVVSHGFRSYSCNDGCHRDFLDWKTYRQHLIRDHDVPLSIHNASSHNSGEPPPKIFKPSVGSVSSNFDNSLTETVVPCDSSGDNALSQVNSLDLSAAAVEPSGYLTEDF